MKKLLLLAFFAAGFAVTTNAQEKNAQEEKKPSKFEWPQWVKNIKFSGYAMLQYQRQDLEGAKSNQFNLRLARFIMDGKIGDFDWRTQIQGTNVKGPGEPTVQLIDLYTEWRRYPEFKIRIGQFKRAFTFENPTHPITQGWRSYADVINCLSGFADRTGEKSSGGRDIGIQLAGDILPNSNGRKLLHYQIGIYNGEGINRGDKDNRKDIMGGIWVMPINGLRIGAFGWTGSHGDLTVAQETVSTGLYNVDVNGNPVAITQKKAITASVPLNRYCLSAEYNKDEYFFRAEYIHSQGWGSGSPGNTIINYDLGDKADGWYAFGIVPVIKTKLYAKARYQTYRVKKEWSSAKTSYEVGMNYNFNKYMEMHLEYARINDKSLSTDKHSYNLIDVELDFKF